MRTLSIICSLLLIIAAFKLPIGYYSIIRIIIPIGSISLIMDESKKKINIWVFAFAVATILFNPIIPIYLNNKSIWIPIDITFGLLFLIQYFRLNKR